MQGASSSRNDLLQEQMFFLKSSYAIYGCKQCALVANTEINYLILLPECP